MAHDAARSSPQSLVMNLTDSEREALAWVRDDGGSAAR
jgi:hypothetical protein